MNKFCSALCVALLAMPAITMAGESGCDTVNFGEDVLSKFPNAAKACHGVTMKNGAAYAHYVAEVVATDKDTVTVHLIDKQGKGISKVVFAPAEDQRVRIDGKETRYTDLKTGTKLDFWIEHSKWGLYASPEGPRMTILSREDL